jgi:hypothetical protein
MLFKGYFDSFSPIFSKDEKEIYVECLDLLGIMNNRNLHYAVSGGTLKQRMTQMLHFAGLLETGDGNGISFDGSDYKAENILVRIGGDENMKRAVELIKQRHAVHIFLTRQGRLRITTPFWLYNQRKSAFDFILSFIFPNRQAIDAWEFLVGENVMSIDYGNTFNDINAMVVLGFGEHEDQVPTYSVGVAIDPIGVQLAGGKYVYETIHDYSLHGQVSCDNAARNHLIDRLRSHQVELHVPFSPFYELGDPFTINDKNRFTGNEVFVLRQSVHSISKGDVSTKIKGSKNALVDLPTDIVMEQTGITNIDNLVSIDKLGSRTDFGV